MLNPKLYEAPGARLLAQPGFLTVTCEAAVVYVAFQSEATVLAAGRSNSRVQPFSAVEEPLVMV